MQPVYQFQAPQELRADTLAFGPPGMQDARFHSGIAEHVRNPGEGADRGPTRFAARHGPGVAARVAATSGTPRAIAHERTKMGVDTHGARRLLSTAIAVAGLGWSTVALAAAEAPAEHGLSQKAVEIATPFGFPITNSMVVTWIVALGLIVFAQVATRRMTEVPTGAQNLLEWLVESLYGLLESIIGPHLVRKTFWFFGTLFLFILAANWVGLVPGVGTIGWGHHTSHGFVIDQPFFRAPTPTST